MSPPTPIETLAQSLHCAFPINYPIFDEGDDVSDGMSEDIEKDCMEEIIMKESTTNKHEKDERLAERTSEILSNYRAFLHEHDMETASRGSLDPPEDGFRDLHYYEHRIKNNLSSSNHGGNDQATCLLRDFSMPDVPLGSCEGISEERRRYRMPQFQSSKRVRSGIFMLGGLLLAVIVVVGVSSKKGPDKNEMPSIQNTPGWHSEAAYILEHENGHEAGRLPHYDIMTPKKESLPEPMEIKDIPAAQILEPTLIEDDLPEESADAGTEANTASVETVKEPEEPSTQVLEPLDENYVSVESIDTETEVIVVSEKTEAETEVDAEFMKPVLEQEVEAELTKTTGDTDIEPIPADAVMSNANAAATSSIASFDLGKILHDKFKPLWLGPREGWNGGSHSEAMQFCKSIRGKELCPYSAMCPYGSGQNVMAGRKPVDFSGEGEQYAPVYGHGNRWILVGQLDGDPSSTCKSHEQLHMRPPSWGLNSDQAEKKQHIMCCTMPNQ